QLELYISNIAVAFLTLLLCINIKDKRINSKMEYIGRVHSLNIYLYHIFLIPFATKILMYLPLSEIKPLILFLSSWFFSEFIIFIKRKKTISNRKNLQ
ncbi:MAG: hypothetical protein ACRCZQ_09430, partial [Bacteroidales bacterium]